MQQNQARIQELFTSWFNGTLSAIERSELETFSLQEGFDETLPDLLKKQWQELKATDDFSIEQRRLLGKRITDQYPSEIPAPVLQQLPPSPGLRLINRWAKYAAAIIILLGVGVYIYTIQQKKNVGITNAEPSIEKDILPGTERAVLTLSNGEKIELNNATSETIQDENLSIENHNGQLNYYPGSQPIPSNGGVAPGAANPRENHSYPGAGVGYNTMTTPRGGQYKLTLSDGTKVWLNAASSITYPTAFKGKTREITVNGEAYFEVAKNKEKPFIVKTDTDQITVLGTSFNVNNYNDEPENKTTLVEGAVKVNNKVLQPGQAYSNGKILKTNIEQDIAWKNGFFSFNKSTIQTVMRQLSRWYAVEIKYAGKIPEGEFSGAIGRNLTLAQVMSLLSESGINYEIKNNTIIVLP